MNVKANVRSGSFGMPKMQFGKSSQYDVPPKFISGPAPGKGIAVVKVDPATGSVTSAWMQKSTGQAVLDNAALRAFRRWRFRPRRITTLEIPIQFTSKGVFY